MSIFSLIGFVAMFAAFGYLALFGVAANRLSLGFTGKPSWIGIAALIASAALFYALCAYGPLVVTTRGAA